MASRSPLAGIVMGSASDWEVMREAAKQLTDFSVPFETKVLSAHRTPEALARFLAIYDTRLLAHTRPYDGVVEVVEVPTVGLGVVLRRNWGGKAGDDADGDDRGAA